MTIQINLADLEDTVIEAPKATPKASAKAETQEQVSVSDTDTVSNSVDTAALLIDLERKAKSILSKVHAEAISDAGERADQLLGQIRQDLAQLKSMRSQVMHFKFNAGETKKLKFAAHPKLQEVLKVLHTKTANGRWHNLFLYGPAGSGKTSLAAQSAEAMGWNFYAITLTAGASETWLAGRWTPNGFVVAGFMNALKDGGLVLLDEICAADPNTLMFINSILDASPGTMISNPISGESFPKHPEFRCIGADNTVGMGANAQFTGRNRQDGAFRDRWTFAFLDYCDAIDRAVCPDDELREVLVNARQVLADKRSEYFIGTRALDKAYSLKQAGFKLDCIYASLTAGWPADLAKQAGLVA